MEEVYVYILDYCSASCKVIKLTHEEVKESEKYDDFEEYLSTLENKYGFRLSDVNWMVSDSLFLETINC